MTRPDSIRPTARPTAGVLLLAAVMLAPCVAHAQQARTTGRLSVERIFRQSEFASEPMPRVDWLRDGRSYVELRPGSGGGTDIVRVDIVTGQPTVLVPASAIVGTDGKRLDVEEITLSDDESKALLFHDSRRVWRTNTRGVYHVLDLATRKLTPIVTSTESAKPSRDTDTANASFLGKNPTFLGRGLASGAADPELQQFAKFSPDGRMIAFVRANDLWVTELATGATRRLTADGSDDIINGTTDWVYEEELGLQDAFRWSPDSRRIAFWRFDQSEVPAFPMVDELGVYPVVSVLRYPKAGMPNSRVKVGVIDLAGATTAATAAASAGVPAPRWLSVGGDTGLYLARVEWVGSDSVVVQRLTRKQDRNDLLMLSATTGTGRTMFTDRDSAYVDVNEGPLWVDGMRRFVYLSDRSGWRAVHLVDRTGRVLRQLTPQGTDVLEILSVDDARKVVYVVAAAPTALERQVYRVPLDGKAWQRVTTERGAHSVQIAPGARYAIDIRSSLGVPASAAVHELPTMRKVRDVAENAALRQKLAGEGLRAPEFLKVPTPSGTLLDAYRIVPADFDSTRKYPVLMYVYGGPASPQVVDQWGGTRYLFHQMLAQRGFVVMVVDNRGAAWRGNAFRKVTQYQLGRHETADQIEAARWLGRQSWTDAARIGIWGWSYGGYMASLAAMRGGDVFRAAVAVAPVTDWRLYDTIYTERFMWTPADNTRGYDTSAPVKEVGNLTASLLLAHGTGDDNVHAQNTTQLAEALIQANKPFTMLSYPNRTHSISGRNATAHLFAAIEEFVVDKLGSVPQATVTP